MKYEIHLGRTEGPDCDKAWLSVGDRTEGASSSDGRIQGCYLHGLFAADGFRRQFLNGLGAQTSDVSFDAQIETSLDALADHLETHLDIDALLALATKPQNTLPFS